MTRFIVRKNELIYMAILLISLAELDTVLNGLRYLKYLVLPFSVVYLLMNTTVLQNLKKGPIIAFLLLLTWSVVNLLFAPDGIEPLGLKDQFFIACYLVPLLSFYSNAVSVEFLFKIFFVCTTLSFVGMEAQEFSLDSSTAPFESAASFVFGAFCIYFLLEKNNRYFILSLIMLFLTLKRIALLGVIVVVLFNAAPLVFKQKWLSRRSFMVFSMVMLASICLIGGGVMDDIIYDITGKSANWFTLGRTSHYAGLFEEIYKEPWSLILGNGIGSSYKFASVFYEADIHFDVVNLHSDLLKILFELGIVFFVIFFGLLSKNMNFKAILMLMYLVVVYLTDNILIYTGSMFIILTLTLKLSDNQSVAR